MTNFLSFLFFSFKFW